MTGRTRLSKIIKDEDGRSTESAEQAREKESKQKRIISVIPEFLKPGTSDSHLVFLKLPHPRTQEPRIYVTDSDFKRICETNVLNGSCRSWFIGDSVEEDGQLIISTEMDLVYLALPYYMNLKSACPLDQVLLDEKFPDLMKINLDAVADRVGIICDQKGDPTLRAFKYNEEKSLAWLKDKASSVASFLREEKINVSHSSKSASYVTKQDSAASDDSYMRYACGILSEYLPPVLSDKLHESLGISVDEPVVLPEPDFENPAKKPKVEPKDDYSLGISNSNSKVKPLSAKEKSLASAAKGSKSITSFFGKK